jgi:hypothetical protein
MAPPKKSSKNDHTKLKKVASKKAPPRKKVPKGRGSPKKAEKAEQARIELELTGPTEELGKLLFDLFQAHDLNAGHVKEIARDVKIELLPVRMAKGAPSVVVLLTIALGVPESVASDYLWHKCEKFSKGGEVKILVNRTEYVYNEHELKKIIKTTMEKQTAQK